MPGQHRDVLHLVEQHRCLLLQRFELLELLRLPHLEKSVPIGRNPFLHHVHCPCRKVAIQNLASSNVKSRGLLALGCMHMRRVVLEYQERAFYDLLQLQR